MPFLSIHFLCFKFVYLLLYFIFCVWGYVLVALCAFGFLGVRDRSDTAGFTFTRRGEKEKKKTYIGIKVLFFPLAVAYMTWVFGGYFKLWYYFFLFSFLFYFSSDSLGFH